MHVRDAREADANALAAFADVPTEVIGNLVHDRTVRVAEAEATDPSVASDADRLDGTDPENVLGFVSFDAGADAVTITQLRGTEAACDRLLSEPVSFAAGESMDVEALTTPDDEPVIAALEANGFERVGAGPRFDGTETVLFRLE
ncbi:hypothetical protein [Halovivax limisalsi]|uniref:hypothetical protein n=1 Tax=Halovivax limisalsi TaxID=1453760 RepID=UPI001FFD8DBD|nr:hypothetical protein [Halovivax limisalsi]